MAKSKTPKAAPPAPALPDTSLVIEQRAVDGLTEYDKNARIIPQSGVDAVAGSIAKFGFRQPLVITEDGIVVVGHTRLRAAKQLGLTTVPVTVMRGDAAAIRAYRLADNRTNQESTWDQDILREELGELSEMFKGDADLLSSMTGFQNTELDAFIGTLATTGGNLDVGRGTGESDRPAGRERSEDAKIDGEKCQCPRCGFGFHAAGTGTRVIKRAKKLFGEAED